MKSIDEMIKEGKSIDEIMKAVKDKKAEMIAAEAKARLEKERKAKKEEEIAEAKQKAADAYFNYAKALGIKLDREDAESIISVFDSLEEYDKFWKKFHNGFLWF